MSATFDAIIPARAGSMSLPGKNRRTLVDRPLFLHSVACAAMTPGIRTVLVTTDDPLIAEAADDAGAYVPEIRPEALATARTPMVDVIRYCMPLLSAAPLGSSPHVVLLDPTSPLRDPFELGRAVDLAANSPSADGVIAISRPSFNPLWVGVELDEQGMLRRHSAFPEAYSRRQDVPDYRRINGSFYVWTREFARDIAVDWVDQGRLLSWEIPDLLSHSIDTEDDFHLVEALVETRVVELPWLGFDHER